MQNLEIPNELKQVVKMSIVGGTDAWLSINMDEEHMKNSKKPVLGYRTEDKTMKDGPYGPFHEPKGNDIEKAML